MPSGSEAASVIDCAASDIDWDAEPEVIDVDKFKGEAAVTSRQETAFASSVPVPTTDEDVQTKTEIKAPRGAASKAVAQPMVNKKELKRVEKAIKEKILKQDELLKMKAEEQTEPAGSAAAATSSSSAAFGSGVRSNAMVNFHAFAQVVEASVKAAEKLGTDAMQISLGILQNIRNLASTGRLDVEPAFQPNHFLCFCTCVHGREETWKLAVPLQLAAGMKFIHNVKFFVVTFAHDVELLRWAGEKFQWAINSGLLHLASGGSEGLAEKGVSVDAREQRRQGETTPVPIARYWHASVGKNSSHIFALKHMQNANVPTTDFLLCNLDCDNFFSPAYISAVARHWYIEKQILADAAAEATGSPGSAGLYPFRALVAQSQHDGMTGRICLQASDFTRVGGYDQEAGIVGTGYQDVDLLRRLQATILLHTQLAPNVYPLRASALHNKVSAIAGSCFPNKPGASVADDRGWLKIENCDPADKERLKKWGRFNNVNHQLMQSKLKNGRIGRNGAQDRPTFDRQPEHLLHQFLALGLGCWFTPVRVGMLAAPQPTRPAPQQTQPASSSSASTVPEAARARGRTPPPEPARAPSQAARESQQRQAAQTQDRITCHLIVQLRVALVTLSHFVTLILS